MKQRSIKIAFYDVKLILNWDSWKCATIQKIHSCEKSHTFTDLSHSTDHIGLTTAS